MSHNVDPGVENVLDQDVDLAEYARRGQRPPLARGYRLRINGDAFVISQATPTGRDILTLGGLLPAENYTLRVKLSNQRPKKVKLDERVDLTVLGIERFKAVPRDQTEG
ncbi:MAG: multiubiquitin domain-containing protein [Vulcanimicrobiota bacterium]